MNRTLTIFVAIIVSSGAGATLPAYARKMAAGVAVNVNVQANRRNKKVDPANAPGFTEAVAAYNAGKYAEALKKLETLNESGFSCDLVRYYIALCYHGQNQIRLAQTQYQWIAAH
ncbi:MAG: hypothetical protein ACRD3W_00390, partial [Terriglobales bacterium]